MRFSAVGPIDGGAVLRLTIFLGIALMVILYRAKQRFVPIKPDSAPKIVGDVIRFCRPSRYR
ncbi:MAG: hypothetical protein ACT4OL_00570 [Nitrospiraceae bacterium]